MARLVSLFCGEERRGVEVVSLVALHRARKALAIGEGWGQVLRGTEIELRNLGAYEAEEGWLLDCGDDGYLGCTVLP